MKRTINLRYLVLKARRPGVSEKKAKCPTVNQEEIEQDHTNGIKRERQTLTTWGERIGKQIISKEKNAQHTLEGNAASTAITSK